MSLVTTIPLTDLISKNIINHFENILNCPNKYILEKMESDTSVQDIDVNNTMIPGVNDDFILKKNYLSEQWKLINIISSIKTNAYKVALPPMATLLPLISYIEKSINLTFVKPSGNFLYPENGYMGWHNNADNGETRVYISYVREERDALFKYYNYEKDKIETIFNNKGLSVLIFTPGTTPDKYFWHCVVATKPRLSFGFRFK